MLTSIITGDIIASRKKSNPDVWLKPLRQSLSQFGNEPQNWEIFRGDSFQLEVPQIAKSLSTCIKIKADMRCSANVNTRMAIGIGTKSYGGKKITESNGEAFVRAGEQFDQLKKDTLSLKSPWPDIDREINLYLDLALLTIDHWSTYSAEAVKLMLEAQGSTQNAIAKKLKITQGRVSERLGRAGYEEIISLINRYEELMYSKVQEL
ncbi:MAG: hypothetical protein KDC53_18930 [Saprospiraceae bacterium]|nr:hypothetical protein [Saprospiraceae bacterium]